MQLHVVCIALKCRKSLEVPSRQSVNEVLKTAVNTFHLEWDDDFRFMFLGKEVPNSKSISEVGITTEDNVFLVLKSSPFGTYPRKQIDKRRMKLLEDRAVCGSIFYPEGYYHSGLPMITVNLADSLHFAVVDTGSPVSFLPRLLAHNAGLLQFADPRFDKPFAHSRNEVLVESLGKITLCSIRIAGMDLAASFVVVPRGGVMVLGCDFILKHRVVIDMEFGECRVRGISAGSLVYEDDAKNVLYPPEEQDLSEEVVEDRVRRKKEKHERKQRSKNKKAERRSQYEETLKNSQKTKKRKTRTDYSTNSSKSVKNRKAQPDSDSESSESVKMSSRKGKTSKKNDAMLVKKLSEAFYQR